MILYHAADLLWATRIKGAADALGIPARPVRNPSMLADRLRDCDAKALIVDLADPATAVELISNLRATPARPGVDRPVRVLAFGPHVDTAAFASARAAGADTLMSRGALAGSLPKVLASLVADLSSDNSASPARDDPRLRPPMS